MATIAAVAAAMAEEETPGDTTTAALGLPPGRASATPGSGDDGGGVVGDVGGEIGGEAGGEGGDRSARPALAENCLVVTQTKQRNFSRALGPIFAIFGSVLSL